MDLQLPSSQASLKEQAVFGSPTLTTLTNQTLIFHESTKRRKTTKSN